MSNLVRALAILLLASVQCAGQQGNPYAIVIENINSLSDIERLTVTISKAQSLLELREPCSRISATGFAASRSSDPPLKNFHAHPKEFFELLVLFYLKIEEFENRESKKTTAELAQEFQSAQRLTQEALIQKGESDAGYLKLKNEMDQKGTVLGKRYGFMNAQSRIYGYLENSENQIVHTLETALAIDPTFTGHLNANRSKHPKIVQKVLNARLPIK